MGRWVLRSQTFFYHFEHSKIEKILPKKLGVKIFLGNWTDKKEPSKDKIC